MPTIVATLDWDRVIEAMGLVVVLGALVERALSLLFESRALGEHFKQPGVKQLVALIVAQVVVFHTGADAFAAALDRQVSTPGLALTGAAVSLGARAAAGVFVSALGIRSSYLDQQLRSGRQRGLAWPSRPARDDPAPA